MTKPRKALIFISNEGDVQRFVLRKAFAALARDFELHYALPAGEFGWSGGTLPPEAEASAIDEIVVGADRVRAWNYLIELFFFRHQKESNAYEARVRGVYLPVYGKGYPLAGVLREGAIGKVRYVWRWIKYLIPNLSFWRTRILGSRALFARVRQGMLKKLRASNVIGAYIDKVNPDVVLLPTSFHDLFVHDVQAAMATRPAPCLLLQSNWDNPSSKGQLFYDPEYVGLWGEQSKRLSMRYTGLREQSISFIGAAQFEDFRDDPEFTRDELLARLRLNTGDRYFIYAGNARSFDDLHILSLLEAAIDRGDLPPTRIVYRPHPWTVSKYCDEFVRREWKYTVLDADSNGTTVPGGFNFYYSFAHLNALYAHAECLVVPMSTVIVEAIVKGLPVVAIAYSDRTSYYGPEMISKMEHCLDLWNIEGIFKCENEADLVPMVASACRYGEVPANKTKLHEASRYFVDMGDRPYGERLRILVERILEKTAAKVAAQ